MRCCYSLNNSGYHYYNTTKVIVLSCQHTWKHYIHLNFHIPYTYKYTVVEGIHAEHYFVRCNGLFPRLFFCCRINYGTHSPSFLVSLAWAGTHKATSQAEISSEITAKWTCRWPRLSNRKGTDWPELENWPSNLWACPVCAVLMTPDHHFLECVGSVWQRDL